MEMKQDHSAAQDDDFRNGQWVEIANDRSPHESPLHEYNNGYGFMSSSHVSMDSIYSRQMPTSYAANPPLHPLIMPQWPSQITNPSEGTPPVIRLPRPLAPVSAIITPHSAPPAPSAPAPSTARKTLTDQDRRKMCQYHEDHPTVKQTEIGGECRIDVQMKFSGGSILTLHYQRSLELREGRDPFDVVGEGREKRRKKKSPAVADRWYSTVSKVLRQKEKYLFPEDDARSPIKRTKGKFPDIERALSNWAKKHQRQGLPLNDDIIREKARFFATTVGSTECHANVNNLGWLEKFKQKNQLLGAKSRKDSEVNEPEIGLLPESKSGSETPNGISPISPDSMLPGSPLQGQENRKNESPNGFLEFSSYRHGHSQSTTSLISSFSENTLGSAFSGDMRSPTSPFFSPASSCGPSPCMPSQQARLPLLASANSQRPRRGTFPAISTEPSSYMTPPPGTSEPSTPKYLLQSITSSALESPIEELDEPSLGIDSTMQQQHSRQVTNTNSPISMAPPPNPSMSASPSSNVSPTSPPSQDEARRALEVLMTFFKHQPGGVDPQEYITMGKLMEKLKLQSNALPGGMHSMNMGDRGDSGLPINRKRSIHSL